MGWGDSVIHMTHMIHTIQSFEKSAVASPLLILIIMLDTHTRRGLGGLHDTHDTYDTYDIVCWKIGGGFATQQKTNKLVCFELSPPSSGTGRRYWTGHFGILDLKLSQEGGIGRAISGFWI